MKHILLATTALTMSASVAAADVSWSGRANAGVSSVNGDSVTSSGIDLNVSASVTTDTGVTLTVGDDFGGGSLIDWNDDYAVEAQGSDLDQPAVGVSLGNVSVTIDPGEVDDLYDDDQTGDVQVSTTLAGLSIDFVASSDDDAGTNSYALGYTLGAVSFSVSGTSGDDNGDDAMEFGASYAMGDLTLGLSVDNSGAGDDITEGSIDYTIGNGLSISLSADDNDDWDAGVSWSGGPVSINYSTDEESAYEANATYDMGNGATVFASTADANDWTSIGIEFTF